MSEWAQIHQTPHGQEHVGILSLHLFFFVIVESGMEYDRAQNLEQGRTFSREPVSKGWSPWIPFSSMMALLGWRELYVYVHTPVSSFIGTGWVGKNQLRGLPLSIRKQHVPQPSSTTHRYQNVLKIRSTSSLSAHLDFPSPP